MGEKRFDFVGFGALNMDVFYLLRPGEQVSHAVPGLCPGGEVVRAEQERERVLSTVRRCGTPAGKSGGGQAANTAVALTRMGFQCGVLGKVGDDEMGDFLLESLENVDKSHLKRGGNSGMCLCILQQDGERANVVFPGCNDTISLDNSDLDYVRSGRVLHMTSFCSERMLEVQRWLLERCSQDITVTFDPGEIYSRLGVDKLRGILRFTNVLFATSEEFLLMTGKDPRAAAMDIIERGTEVVVHKRGEHGSEIISEDGIVSIPAVRVECVVDRTGAGDVYAAGFIAGLLLDLPLEVCGRLASEAAALSISGYGRQRYPDRGFLRRFLDLNVGRARPLTGDRGETGDV